MLVGISVPLPDWSPGDWGQILGAVFTAIAALAAWATVASAARDRRRAAWPSLHVELLMDMPNQEVRLTVLNYGGPAREVRVLGTIGDFGIAGFVPPSTYWRPGEWRVLKVSMPIVKVDEIQLFVEGRDMAKRYVFVTTYGGKSYRWSLKKAEKMSVLDEWKELFPGLPDPLSVPHAPMDLELLERKQ